MTLQVLFIVWFCTIFAVVSLVCPHFMLYLSVFHLYTIYDYANRYMTVLTGCSRYCCCRYISGVALEYAHASLDQDHFVHNILVRRDQECAMPPYVFDNVEKTAREGDAHYKQF